MEKHRECRLRKDLIENGLSGETHDMSRKRNTRLLVRGILGALRDDLVLRRLSM